MDARNLVAILVILVAVTMGQPIPGPDRNQDIVPGVFISSDVLKDLQNKAQQNQNVLQNNQPLTNLQEEPMATNQLAGNQLKINPNVNVQGSQDQETNPSILSNQQKVQSNQPVVQSNQNEPQILTPSNNQQPMLLSQQPNPQLWVQQPGNQILVPQQGNQVLVQQPSNQLLIQQPNGNQLLVQQPNGNQLLVAQPNGNQLLVAQPNGNQLFVQQPNNQFMVQQKTQPNGVLVNQQPGNQLLVQQRGNQLLVQQPNQQVILPNGQIAQVIGQPNFTGNQMGNNQVTLLQNTRPVNSVQNSGAVYAVVPVNGQTNPNSNLGNGNSYLVPVQQNIPNQMYTVNG